ncbi:A24 family peptidase [Streptomyces sp. ID05-47C]|uniref:prepilin peptidase n=1 Tax=Streptomyces sp. ID05-47C TaxID=3028665 RepID=UPI0029AD262A|nr:A24 family peptidase [Streptomyces sp. ID05-47C]MDX3570117.1 A24 family peptidase [Streptomyces sp. ID05-47C]
MAAIAPIDALLIALAAVWGAFAGAVLPRAAYRFSVELEEAEPEGVGLEDAELEGTGGDAGWRRGCPEGHPLRGWLGPARCPGCPATSPPYGSGALRLSLVTSVLCVGLALATGIRPELAVWLLLAPVGVLLAAVDLRVKRLPDPLTLPLAAVALTLLGVAVLLPEHAGDWTTALLGALALSGGYLVLHLINPAGMGFGDVKLALGAGAVLGWYGWATVMLGTLAAFLSGALYGGALLLARRAGRRTAIPFGPFLIAGVYAGVLMGAYAA